MNVPLQTRHCWLARFGRVGYVAAAGNANLGDEAMFHAFQRIYRRTSPWWPVDLTGRLHQKLLGRRHFFRLGCLGGGTMIFQSPGPIRQLREWRDRGIPLATFGTGVRDPEFWNNLPRELRRSEDVTAEEEWLDLLRGFAAVGVRGVRSAELLNDRGITAEVVGDPALELTAEELAPPGETRHLGVNIGQSYGRLWGGNEQAVLDHMGEAIGRLAENGWGVTLFCVWDEDLDMTHRLADRLGPAVRKVVHEPIDAGRYMDEVRRCEVFLGLKLHAVILAICAGVPGVMVEYRPKCRDFMETLGQQDRCIRCDAIVPADLAERIDKTAENADTIRRDQQQRCLAYRDRLRRYAREILHLADTQEGGR